jgi:uncharacterized protein
MKSQIHDTDPVHVAVMKRSLQDLTRAVVQGNPVDAPDREGRTALFYAVQAGDSETVAQLLRLGANVNAQDKRLETPLHCAARAYQPEVAALLLKSGAKVDSQDVHGNSPLSHAVFESRGRGQMIKLLISSGANEFLKNHHGVSPQELASSISNYDVKKFL